MGLPSTIHWHSHVPACSFDQHVPSALLNTVASQQAGQMLPSPGPSFTLATACRQFIRMQLLHGIQRPAQLQHESMSKQASMAACSHCSHVHFVPCSRSSGWLHLLAADKQIQRRQLSSQSMDDQQEMKSCRAPSSLGLETLTGISGQYDVGSQLCLSHREVPTGRFCRLFTDGPSYFHWHKQ